MAGGTDGIDVAAVAWHDFMTAAPDRLSRGDEWYTPPPGLDAREVDGRTAYFLPGTGGAW